MAKYADITPFYEWLDWLEKESNTSCPEYQTLMFYEIRDKLDTLPEVVRCKDCKHWSMGYCNHFAYYSYEPITHEDDFCSYGERKDND